MKAKTPPTSPKYKVQELEKLYQENKMRIEKPDKKGKGLALMVSLAVIVGFLAGFLGKITFDYLGLNYPDKFGFLNTNENTNQTLEPERQETKTAQSEIYQKISPSLVGIYEKKEKSEDTLEGVYLAGERKGAGLILSSDGLIVTTQATVEEGGEYVVIDEDQEIYPVVGFFPDSATPFVFLKIEGAENIKPAQTADFKELLLGETAYAVNKNNLTSSFSLVASQITSLAPEPARESADLIRSTEILGRLIGTDCSFGLAQEGSALVDKNGRVIGLYSYRENSENKFIPASYFANIINNLLKENEILRPYFGLKYLDLSGAVNISDSLSQEKKAGALIYSEEGPAVEKNSPAEKAGLSEGDIILKVGQITLDKDNDFSEIVQNLSIGETVKLTVERKGISREIEATLGKYQFN